MVTSAEAVAMACKGEERALWLAGMELDQAVLLARRWPLELRVVIKVTVLLPALSSSFLIALPLGNPQNFGHGLDGKTPSTSFSGGADKGTGGSPLVSVEPCSAVRLEA
jgi:hypothetical protein